MAYLHSRFQSHSCTLEFGFKYKSDSAQCKSSTYYDVAIWFYSPNQNWILDHAMQINHKTGITKLNVGIVTLFAFCSNIARIYQLVYLLLSDEIPRCVVGVTVSGWTVIFTTVELNRARRSATSCSQYQKTSSWRAWKPGPFYEGKENTGFSNQVFF